MALGKNEIQRRFGTPTLTQIAEDGEVSEHYIALATWLDEHLPDGPTKMQALTELETAYLWSCRAAEHG